MSLRLVHQDGRYDFYLQPAIGDLPALYNIVPLGSPTPKGGYFNRQAIERLKGVRFPDRHQPTLHGMSELYPNKISDDLGS